MAGIICKRQTLPRVYGGSRLPPWPPFKRHDLAGRTWRSCAAYSNRNGRCSTPAGVQGLTLVHF